LRVKIGGGDFDTKVNHVRRFLKDGHKVKVTIMFRGRERTHPELGEALLKKVAFVLGEYALVEVPPIMFGMDMNMIVAPTAKSATMPLKANLPPDVDPTDDGDDHDDASPVAEVSANLERAAEVAAPEVVASEAAPTEA
jgi:translation initiation factor IF-3